MTAMQIRQSEGLSFKPSAIPEPSYLIVVVEGATRPLKKCHHRRPDVFLKANQNSRGFSTAGRLCANLVTAQIQTDLRRHHQYLHRPQVTIDPSARIATNELRVAWTCWTSLSWSRTLELSPPKCGLPQVTTDPSARIAANAHSVPWICYFRAVTTITWSAPRDNLVTSRAEHCKSPSCCRYLCLYSNSCQVVSLFQSCSLQRHCRIHIAIIANIWVPRNDLEPNFMDDREIDDETFPPGSTSQPSST